MGLLAELLVPLTQELSKLSTPVLVGVLWTAFVTISVVVNVLLQLLCKDKTKPPVVFHLFPWLGSTVDYGQDPYAFFFKCQKKVSSSGGGGEVDGRWADNADSMGMCSRM